MLRVKAERATHNLRSILNVKPVTCAADLHPDSLSALLARPVRLAIEYVQHHHAHAAACMAENG